MKMQNWLVSFGLVVFLVGCGGGGGDAGTSPFGGGTGTGGTGGGTGGGTTATALFSSAPSSLIISVGATSQPYAISGGTAGYTVTSSNPTVATATVGSGSFVVNGLSGGSAVLTIKDALGAAVDLAVTVGSGGTNAVVLFTTAPSSLIVAVGGSSQTYAISGGTAGYSVTSSNPSIATATVGNANFVVNGVGGGSAVLTIKDAVGAAVNVAVTIGSATTLFATAPNSVSVAIGTSQTYMLGGGASPYTASSANGGVATASVAGTALTISGVSLGSTTVVVRDSLGSLLSLAVSANPASALFTSAPNDITIATGVSATYAIGGGVAGYTATSTDARVATVNVSGPSMTIAGAAAGTAKVVIRDSVGGTVTLNLIVGSPIALFSSAPASISSLPGATQTYSIGGGEGPYVVGTSNSAAATATVNGSTLSISGVATGTAQVVVKDALGAAVPVAVMVTPAASIPLAVTPLAVTASVGDPLKFTVTGGDGPYTVTVNNANIASVMPLTVAASGGTFDANLLNAGATTIAIIDTNGQTQTVSLTVNQLQPLLRLSPLLVAVSESFAGSIALDTYGGMGPYTAFTSDLKLSSVSVSGSRITVNTGTNGNRCIDSTTPGYITTLGVVEPYNTLIGTVHIVITVVDATGRSTFSDLFIVDNGGTCP